MTIGAHAGPATEQMLAHRSAFGAPKPPGLEELVAMKTPNIAVGRRGRVLCALAGAALVIGTNQPTPTVDAAPTPSTAAFCLLEPAADTMQLGPALAGTLRSRGSGIEMLHRVECDGLTVGWKWLTPSDILADLVRTEG